MTDMNKPVKITHDPVTGDILDMTNYDLLSPPSEEEKDADDIVSHSDDWWSRQEIFGADLTEIEALELHAPTSQRLAELKRIESEKRMSEARLRDDEANNRRFLEAQKAERSRQWREEASGRQQTHDEIAQTFIETHKLPEPATIHTYPYSKTEPMTIDELKEQASKSTIPTPGDVAAKALSKSMEQVSVSATIAVKGMKEFSKAVGKASDSMSDLVQNFEARESFKAGHLTHRPFHNLQLIVLRDELSKNQ